jgi:predicted neuraminidase
LKVIQAEKQFVFESQRFFQSCHASTVAALPNGDVAAAWFAGTKEGADDVDIWLSLRKNGIWKDPVLVAGEDGLPHWNPVLFYTYSGKLQLYYKVGSQIHSWQTRLITSDDLGVSWSKPRELVQGNLGGRGPVRCKPIYLSDRSILAPSSIETETVWDAFTDQSHDDGLTWARSRLVPIDHESFAPKGIIQPTLWQSDEGIHMMVRSSAGEIYRSDSLDNAKTWSQAYSVGLPNNNSGIDVVKLDNGILALIYNPVSENWGPRTPLVIRFSSDNGVTWAEEFILEDEPGEYSYPAIIANNNQLLVSYTWKREIIAFWTLTIR